MDWDLVMGLKIEWGLDTGQGLKRVRDGVRITNMYPTYYLVIRFLHGSFKTCKNTHTKWTKLKNPALTLEKDQSSFSHSQTLFGISLWTIAEKLKWLT